MMCRSAIGMLPHRGVESARLLQKLLVGAGFDDGSLVDH